MEMSNFRPHESHVAQQSRRDKLRIQQSSTNPSHHLQSFPNNLEHLSSSVHPELNPDLIHVRNVRNAKLMYDSNTLSSEMLNCSTNPNVLLAHKDPMLHSDLPNSSLYPISSNFNNNSNPSSKPSTIGDNNPQNCANWKSLVGSQQSCDWIVNYGSGSAAAGRGSNQNNMFVGEMLSNCIKVNNISASTSYLKPGLNGFHDVHSSLTNPSSEISSQDSQKHYGEMHFNSPSIYQNTLQEVVTSAANVHQNSSTRETGRCTWPVGGNELVFLPSNGDQSSNSLRLNNAASGWINRPAEAEAEGCSHQWNGELGYLANKSTDSNNQGQGLSLSLSSKPPPEIHVGHFGERYGSQDSKNLKSGFVMSSNLKPSIGGGSSSSKGYGSSLHDVVGTSAYAHRSSLGPLGPFTGYAAILKSSKFLKPAQQLLDEFCSVTGTKFVKNCDTSSERISCEVNVSIDAVNVVEAEIGGKDGNSGACSSTFRSSNEFSGDGGGVGSSSCEPHRPEHQQKKAKLLYMQDEVCRRYKQYHQQMHMVVSSFESVAGLSAAAPYISLALKMISRHFRCLKNAISDQLKHISKALGENLSSPTTGASSSKGGDIAMSRLKFLNQSFQKHKTSSSGGDLGFLDTQQHIWRPQRGLPERAVAVLRAWLFEHFLHPYPTDTDKHMLATQTGLTRNQVSNWFINARVRVWKPMVEEIHMLETKGLAADQTDLNSGKINEKSGNEVTTSKPNGDRPSNKHSMNANASTQRDCLNAEQWNQEKRSRVEEGQFPASIDGAGSLMGFMPYQRNGLEVGGLGAVSLTLGLRHGAESTQQQQQQQHQEHLLRQHFGGQMIHDFVG